MTDTTQPAVTATWTVELNCYCPKCTQYVNLIEYPDFWDGRRLDIAENNTERSKGLDVYCPDCGEEFKVDCTW